MEYCKVISWCRETCLPCSSLGLIRKDGKEKHQFLRNSLLLSAMFNLQLFVVRFSSLPLKQILTTVQGNISQYFLLVAVVGRHWPGQFDASLKPCEQTEAPPNCECVIIYHDFISPFITDWVRLWWRVWKSSSHNKTAVYNFAPRLTSRLVRKMTAWQPSMLCCKLTGRNKLDGPDAEPIRTCVASRSAVEPCSYVNRCPVSYGIELGLHPTLYFCHLSVGNV